MNKSEGIKNEQNKVEDLIQSREADRAWMLSQLKIIQKPEVEEIKQSFIETMHAGVREAMDTRINMKSDEHSTTCEERTRQIGEATVQGLRNRRKARTEEIAEATKKTKTDNIRHIYEAESLRKQLERRTNKTK